MSGQAPGQEPEDLLNAIHSTLTQSVRAVQSARRNLERLERLERLRNQAVHGSILISVPPAIIRAAGSGEATEVREVHGADLIGVDLEARVKVGPAPPTPRPMPLVAWLDRIAFFVPKSIREPFLGDLREDLTNKAATGASRASVWCAAISQVVLLALRWVWSSVGRR